MSVCTKIIADSPETMRNILVGLNFNVQTDRHGRIVHRGTQMRRKTVLDQVPNKLRVKT